MSILKQLLSPFVEFEGEKKPDPAPEKEYKPSPVTPVYQPAAPAEVPVTHPLFNDMGFTSDTVAPPVPEATRSTLTTALPEHKQYFEKLIDESNAKNLLFQGVDYKEFIDSKLNIDDITDEETKYKTAFNILKKSGLSKQKLISTAQEYHNIIGRDLNAFQSVHAQQYQKEVGQREKLIQQKAEELHALTQQIAALKTGISQLSQELNVTRDKFNLTKNSFLLAGENMQHEIQSELQKIEKYF